MSSALCRGSQGGSPQLPPDLMLPSAGQSLWVPLPIPVQETRSHRPSSIPVGELFCTRLKPSCGDPKRAEATAEATAETPQGRQSVIHTQMLLFLFCSHSVSCASELLQHSSRSRVWLTLTGPCWESCPNPFPLYRSQDAGVEEEKETVISGKALQSITAQSFVGQIHPTSTHTVPSCATQHSCFWEQVWLKAPTAGIQPHSHTAATLPAPLPGANFSWPEELGLAR